MNKLSIEELIKYAEEKVANLTKVIDQSAFTSIKERLIEELQLAQVGLDALRSSLKGDQVPVAQIVISKNWPDAGRKVIDYYIDKIQHLPVGAELFTAPQKPVVLPGIGGVEPTSAPEFVNYADGWRDGINECRKAIEAAGCIVKHGE